MKVIHDPAELHAGSRPVCAAIGVFDGVHLGHQRVLLQTIADAALCHALSVAVTFDCHPNAVVAPANVPPMIYPPARNLEVIASLGIDAACVIRFDSGFSRISGEHFVRQLAGAFRPLKSISVGRGFMFGYRRSGDVALLQRLGGELGFTVHALPDVELAGQPVSSTRIREAVRAGDFAAAGQMLGRPYSLRGPVIEGQHIGRKLGFPTANIDVTGLLVPPTGVYVACARAGTAAWRAAANIGHRPTVQSADPQIHVEAHLLDFDGDLGGQELELTLLKKLRDEQKFPSAEALRAQITQDIEQTRKYP
ncbi:MAG: bifunctional riboflavin kinase/FAD synthetase [Verrucomicrobiota bacterium]|jgi:riboflavin kinase/FMN adenylyltransferase